MVAVLLVVGCGRIDFGDLGTVGDGAVSDACTPAVTLESLSTGELVIDTASTSASAPMAVPLDRTILFTSLREAEPSPSFGNTMCTLAAGGITCTRLDAGTDYAGSTGAITVRWTVATFTAGVSVQRGIGSLTVSVPNKVALNPIDPAASFVVLNGSYMNTGQSWGTDEFIRARLTDGQTLEVTADATSSVVAWQVVTMAGASVQRGTSDFAPTDLETLVPIAAVDSARTFALVSNTENSTVGLGAAMSLVSARLSDPSTLHLARASGGAPVSIAWEVISVPFAVEHGDAALAAGVTSATFPMTGTVASSVALATEQTVLGASGGTTDLADGTVIDMVGEGEATLALSPAGLTVARATSLSNADFPWAVLDFASCR